MGVGWSLPHPGGGAYRTLEAEHSGGGGGAYRTLGGRAQWGVGAELTASHRRLTLPPCPAWRQGLG